jgi:shikimate kinase
MWTSLIGFMGSGKTSVARQAARGSTLLSMDLDELVERRCGEPIAQIFSEQGEDAFRRHELAALESLPADRPVFLACGGGTVETPAARSLLRERGVVIWLDAPWHIVNARLIKDVETRRPLVRLLGPDRLRQLYTERQALYAAAADFRLISSAHTVDELTRQVMYSRLRFLRRIKERGAA